jgi:hypothetical protein
VWGEAEVLLGLPDDRGGVSVRNAESEGLTQDLVVGACQQELHLHGVVSLNKRQTIQQVIDSRTVTLNTERIWC